MLWCLPGIKFKITSSNLKDSLHEVGLLLQTKHDFKGYRVPHDIDDPSEFLNMCADLDILECGPHTQPSIKALNTVWLLTNANISQDLITNVYVSIKTRTGIKRIQHCYLLSQRNTTSRMELKKINLQSPFNEKTHNKKPHWLTTHHIKKKTYQKHKNLAFLCCQSYHSPRKWYLGLLPLKSCWWVGWWVGKNENIYGDFLVGHDEWV